MIEEMRPFRHYLSGVIISLGFEQEWGLDALGNWNEFDQDVDGVNSWDLQQKHYHNHVNEIDTDNTHGDADDAIVLQQDGAGSNWADPVYDAAGNMTKQETGQESGDRSSS